MSTDRHESVAPDRRSLLRGAAAAGALVWATPAVQVLAAPAYAAGTLAPELSYVALLLQKGSTYYRVKYAFNSMTSAPVIEVAAGPDWTAGLCDQKRSLPFYQGGAGLSTSGGKSLSPSAPPTSVVANYDVYNGDGGFYVVLPVGVAILDWLVHKGQCCARQASGTDDFATCQPDATGAAYKMQFLQYVDAGAKSGNQWLFPASPNDAACQKLGSKTYTQSCVPTSVSGTPRR